MRRRVKCFRSSESLFSLSVVYVAQFYKSRTRTLPNAYIFVGLVRDRSGDQEVRTDLLNIFVRQSNLVFEVVFGGPVFLAKPAEECGDPLRPLVCISDWFREIVVLWTHFELLMFIVPSQSLR